MHEVELRIIPVSRTSERQLLRKALFMPASMRPMLPVRKQAKVDCEAVSIAASEWESELTGGPREEEISSSISGISRHRSKPQKEPTVSP
jgi:hypothetical protein